MTRRPLGTSGIEVSTIGVGCMGFAGVYGPVDEHEAIRSVHRALDLGLNLFDTADAYGNGVSEQLLARALQGRRQEAVIATKFGNIDHFGDRPMVDAIEGRWETNGRPEYVRAACEASLARLRTDVIDLYYLHRVDPNTPIEDTVGAMADLVRAGKVRAIGLSEAGPETIRRACAIHPLAALQSEYSLWTRDPEGVIFDLCIELGVTFIAYSPLGRGFLAGQVIEAAMLSAQDWRRHQPRLAPGNIERNMQLLDKLVDLARERDATPAALALAWTMARQRIVVPVVGSRKVAHIEANVAACDLRLDAETLAQLDQAFKACLASGDRYPEVQMRRLGL